MSIAQLSEGLLLENEGAVMHITLDRPDGNLVTTDMCRTLTGLLREPPEGGHVLVLTGAGENFCLGRERKASATPELTGEVSDLIALNQALTETRLVTLARVNGPAAGFGAGLAALCDVAVAMRSARFSFPEVTIGLAPTIVLAWLQKAVGRRKAFELTATGKQIDGDELVSLDLVNQVVEDADMLDEAIRDWTDALTQRSPRVHAEIKAMLEDSEHMSADQAYALSAGRLVVGSLLRGT